MTASDESRAVDDAGADRGASAAGPPASSSGSSSRSGSVGRGSGSRRAARAARRREKSSGSFWRELPVLILVALGLALLIKAFLVQAFFIPSGSMEKTLHGCEGCSGDRVLVNKLVHRFRDVERGEIVVFNGVDSWTPEVPISTTGNPLQRALREVAGAFGVAPPGEEDFIKRVIGIPGDTVQCCDKAGRVTVNGTPLVEPYVYQDDHRTFGPVKVPAGRLWVMGDHRSASADSRLHTGDPGGGTIAEDHVIGRAFIKVWPPSRIGTLPVPETFSQPALERGAAAAPAVLGVLGAVPVVLVRRRLATRHGAHARQPEQLTP